MMHGTSHRIEVRPQLPPRLARLSELASNLWYGWHRPTRTLFARLNPQLWQETGHSPKAMLRDIDQPRLDAVATDPEFLENYDCSIAAYDAYHGPRGPLPVVPSGECVAYFSAEFGLHESLPIYSGGLGILAGDHCKTASDLQLPFVAVGLLYRQGYFQQSIDAAGRQQAHFADTDFELLPAELQRRPDGSELRVTLDLPGRVAQCRVWRARVGRVALYLLDTDLDENVASVRVITRQLYGGSALMRLEQEIVLGVGGVRALGALGIEPACWHVNEGHPAFLILERLRQLVARSIPFEVALEAVAAGTVFTTHTAVPAGHDRFADVTVREHFQSALPELRPYLDALLALGHAGLAGEFNMTALAVRGSRAQNGVSRVHGEVSSRICAPFWPQVDPEENPVGHITNGVHVPTFLSDVWQPLLERCTGRPWSEWAFDEQCWHAVRSVPDAEFWEVHQTLKSQMLHLVRHRVRRQQLRAGASEAHIDRILRLVDPERPEILTIGFARRFATYKRTTLLLQRLDWLREILSEPERPVLMLFAGKAHPADEPAREMIRRIAEVAASPEFESRIILIENYDLRLARRLVSGVDVWLNNPVYPMEACGTSGMKAAINGVLNLSVLDGWWEEGYDRRHGWAIKPAPESADEQRRDADEARTLYELLQDQIVPLFYAKNDKGYSAGWVAMAKEAMANVAPRYSSQRMVTEYVERCYLPTAARAKRLWAGDFAAARQFAEWKARVRSAWSGVSLQRVELPAARLEFGGRARIAVAARLNGLAPADLAVELVVARPGARNASEHLERRRLLPAPEGPAAGECLYALDFAPQHTGPMDLRLRAYPSHELLAHPMEMGMMVWL